MRTSTKLALLATLYLSQGLPYGFLTQAVPVMLRREGASLTTIGDTSLLMAPWLLKFLWAPVVDRWWSASIGRRRSWILPLQGLTILVLGGLALTTPSNAIGVLLAATFVTALLASTQDIATDGLAVSLLTHEERGLGNGVQVAGYRLGMVIGGGALLIVLSRQGWSATFASMALLMALASLPILLWREPPPPARETMPPTPWHFMWTFVTRPGVGVWLLLLVAYKLGEQLGGAVNKPMLVDLDLSLETIGWLAGADSVASLLGALLGGWLTGRTDRRRALVGLGMLQATGVALWALPALWSLDVAAIGAIRVYDGFVGSMATAALFTAMMDVCDDEAGGTDFTLQASVVLVAGFLGTLLGGRVADALIRSLGSLESGYVAHYLFAALLTVGGALLVGFFRPNNLETQP